jgi:Tfp pilus assembly protein PilN
MQTPRRTILMAARALHGRSTSELSGSVHMLALAVLTIMFVAGGCYLYSVNRSAVQGYHMRTLEKEIGKLKQENSELKIVEADLRSLYRIEASGEELKMQKLDNVTYLEERGPVALK